MKIIPLQKKLKKEAHRKIAYAQDLVIREVYSSFDNAVLHGGTAIWRCFNGKRFSEDLDFYLDNNKHKINNLFENIKKIGFKIIKQKVSDRSIYSELELNRTFIRLEATFQKVNGTLSDYEMSDGNFISIYSLTKKQFLIEKVNTYLKRFKIRDLWDIFFLIRDFDNLKEVKEIKRLLEEYKKPIDESNLKVIILEGIVPSSNDMLDYIKRKWENKYI